MEASVGFPFGFGVNCIIPFAIGVNFIFPFAIGDVSPASFKGKFFSYFVFGFFFFFFF